MIGRIAIAPDMQGDGIGERLLNTAEEHSRRDDAELFTGSLSEANIRLYERCGYVETERVDQGDGTRPGVHAEEAAQQRRHRSGP